MSAEWVRDDNGVWRDERGRTKAEAFMQDVFWRAKTNVDAMTFEVRQELERLLGQETEQ